MKAVIQPFPRASLLKADFPWEQSDWPPSASEELLAPRTLTRAGSSTPGQLNGMDFQTARAVLSLAPSFTQPAPMSSSTNWDWVLSPQGF